MFQTLTLWPYLRLAVKHQNVKLFQNEFHQKDNSFVGGVSNILILDDLLRKCFKLLPYDHICNLDCEHQNVKLFSN